MKIMNDVSIYVGDDLPRTYIRLYKTKEKDRLIITMSLVKDDTFPGLPAGAYPITDEFNTGEPTKR